MNGFKKKICYLIDRLMFSGLTFKAGSDLLENQVS